MWLEFTSEWWEMERLTRREYLNQRIRSAGVLEKMGTNRTEQTSAGEEM